MTGVLQSIKTALPLPIPGFDYDQSNQITQMLIPLPVTCPTDVATDALSRDYVNQVRTPSLDEVDSDVAHSLTYSSEVDALDQLLSSCVGRIDCQIDSACEAFESRVWHDEELLIDAIEQKDFDRLEISFQLSPLKGMI